MGYIKDFRATVANHDYAKFLHLWEEYCCADEIDADELLDILKIIKKSTLAELFGRHVERVLPLWEKLSPSEDRDGILRLIIDLETTNTEELASLAVHFLKERYGDEKFFSEKMRLAGMKGRESFQGAISNYELLSHVEKGNFVFHTGGWGVGEVVDYSLVREEIALEFDCVPGKKNLSFQVAFKTLVPIARDHFLALRFGDPDRLEKMAREDAVGVIRMLLRDLGPKTASEIKEEMSDLVIPAAEWPRWWQVARSKVKKCAMIDSPKGVRESFCLRKKEVLHKEKLEKILEESMSPAALATVIYDFSKDFPEALKSQELKTILAARIGEALTSSEITPFSATPLHFFLQDFSGEKECLSVHELVQKTPSVLELLNSVEILSFKKRVLMAVRQARSDWKEIFLDLLFKVSYAPLRDYLIGELATVCEPAEIAKKFDELCARPFDAPETFLWYFQRAMAEKSPLFAANKVKLLEALFILISVVQTKPAYRDLVKKVQGIVSAGRYALVREVMQETALAEVKEFLLLTTKCHCFTDHDLKAFRSLAEVVHPSLKTAKEEEEERDEIWTTQEGYQKIKKRIERIATIETVENAKEIEVARSHGDLRENAEFKAALQKRGHLQSELKALSEQIGKARILRKEEILTDQVGVGTVVDCKNKKGEEFSYTLLGPWDADVDRHILSFQSKFAQAMKGLKVGETFSFNEDEFTVLAIRSYL